MAQRAGAGTVLHMDPVTDDAAMLHPDLAHKWQDSPEALVCRDTLVLLRTFAGHQDDHPTDEVPLLWWHMARVRAVELQLQGRTPRGTYVAGEVYATLGL